MAARDQRRAVRVRLPRCTRRANHLAGAALFDPIRSPIVQPSTEDNL